MPATSEPVEERTPPTVAVIVPFVAVMVPFNVALPVDVKVAFEPARILAIVMLPLVTTTSVPPINVPVDVSAPSTFALIFPSVAVMFPFSEASPVDFNVTSRFAVAA